MKNSRQIKSSDRHFEYTIERKKSRKIRSIRESFDVEQTLQALFCHHIIHMQKMRSQ